MTEPSPTECTREELHNDLCTDLWDVAHRWMPVQGQAQMKGILAEYDTEMSRRGNASERTTETGAVVAAEISKRVQAEEKAAALKRQRDEARREAVDLEEEAAAARRARNEKRESEESRARTLEGDAARLRTRAYATETAKGPLTEQLAFAMARATP